MIIVITIRLCNLKFSVTICLTEKRLERKTFTSVVLEIYKGKQYDITSLSMSIRRVRNVQIERKYRIKLKIKKNGV